MYGWQGKILRINLSERRFSNEPLSEETAHKYIGGKGLGTKILLDELEPQTDPLGPNNKLVLTSGPCTGTLTPGNSRLTMSAKSLTGFIGSSSSGSRIAAELKYAGYDAVIIEGKSEKPCYIVINDDDIEIRDAGHIWGTTNTREARWAIIEELRAPEACIATIGQGGENLVRFACVSGSIGNTWGRCGFGAIMGSKNLKAIVVRGKKGVKVADPRALADATKELYDVWFKAPMIKMYAYMGSAGAIVPYNNFGVLPTFNYRQGTYDDIALITGDHQAEWYYSNGKSCYSCHIPCRHTYVINKGPFVGTMGEGIQAGQLEHFTSRLGINNLDFTVKASALCNEYGLDIIEVAGVLGHVMECFDEGLLTSKDTDGLNIEWGNEAACLQAIDKMAKREGFGDILAEGVDRIAAKVKGSEKFALTIKGASLSTRDPRGSKVFALGYATSARGACHTEHIILSDLIVFPGAMGFDPERGEVLAEAGYDVAPLAEEGKGVMLKWYEDLRAFQNCMVICTFVTYQYPKELGCPGMAAKLYNAVTGLTLSSDDVLRIGERVMNLQRIFNIREGLTRKDDSLPHRFLNEPLPDGPAKGQVVNLDIMLDEYYEARGWNTETGFIAPEKLEELGLSEYKDGLQSAGKLG